MVELHQMLYEKNIHKDFSDYNYYCKNGNIYHRCDIINNNVNKILSNVILKKDDLQNKIYFKNLLNQAIKSYAG